MVEIQSICLEKSLELMDPSPIPLDQQDFDIPPKHRNDILKKCGLGCSGLSFEMRSKFFEVLFFHFLSHELSQK